MVNQMNTDIDRQTTQVQLCYFLTLSYFLHHLKLCQGFTLSSCHEKCKISLDIYSFKKVKLQVISKNVFYKGVKKKAGSEEKEANLIELLFSLEIRFDIKVGKEAEKDGWLTSGDPERGGRVVREIENDYAVGNEHGKLHHLDLCDVLFPPKEWLHGRTKCR